MTYDEVGNMTSDGENYDYEYDAFGRLRKVVKTGTSDLVAEYRYNGLNQRIASHFDVDEDGTVETAANGDPWWYFAFDSRWRTVARAVERSGSTPIIVEQWVHHHAGLVSSGSGSYIDSVILRDRDTSGGGDGTLDERVYYLQNWRADVVALITDAGAQVEQVRYEPYGSPFGIPAGDVDASGAVDGTDATAVTAWYNAPSYDVRGDLDMDGDIDTADLALLEDAKDAAATLGLYQLSTVDNRKGYAGYELLGELSEAKWDVRNRVLNSRLGRWTGESRGDEEPRTAGPEALKPPNSDNQSQPGTTFPSWLVVLPNCRGVTNINVALQDPRVQQALQEAYDKCNGYFNPGNPVIWISCSSSCEPGEEGFVRPGIPPTVTLCLNDDRSVATWVGILVHEIRHAWQSCSNPNRFYKGCKNRICAEIDALCVEPSGRDCRNPENIRSNCQRVCDSVTGGLLNFSCALLGCQQCCETLLTSGSTYCKDGFYDPDPDTEDPCPNPIRPPPPPTTWNGDRPS